MDWILECSACQASRGPEGLPTVCQCGQPWLVRYPDRRPRPSSRQSALGGGIWRFSEWMPIAQGESPVTLGEGGTPLLSSPRTGAQLGIRQLWIKDESVNPTGSFKARGLSAAITRARAGGAAQFVVPTAGNAGVAASAYAARAGLSVRVYAPASTPERILTQIKLFGGELITLDGHIGDCGKAARAWAAESGAFDLSTLREPYRIEGKKTLGIEIAESFGWQLPDAIFYPTGGGTGLIGMWKAFGELAAAGWVTGSMPRMYSVQSTGCAPIVASFEQQQDRAEPWPNPWTRASGLRVPAPLGDRLILKAIRESGGAALGVSDADLVASATKFSSLEGIDLAPEGGAALAGAALARQRGLVSDTDRVVVFNTGSGWLYRGADDLPPR